MDWNKALVTPRNLPSVDGAVVIAMGWTATVRFPAKATSFYVLHSVQTGSGAHPASCTAETRVRGVKVTTELH
jgi:hypothetical protein